MEKTSASTDAKQIQECYRGPRGGNDRGIRRLERVDALRTGKKSPRDRKEIKSQEGEKRFFGTRAEHKTFGGDSAENSEVPEWAKARRRGLKPGPHTGK